MQKRNKKAAIELSINTIVVIVLAMSMLILGLVLVKNLFSGANNNVNTIADKTKDEINKLFTEDQRLIVYLPNRILKVKQGETWGIEFVIKNLLTGKSDDSSFSYEVSVNDPELKSKCQGITEKEISSWISAGRTGTNIAIAPGSKFVDTIRMSIPEDSPLCTIRFNLNIKESGKTYETQSFDIQVLAK